jgi:hypothetical protein
VSAKIDERIVLAQMTLSMTARTMKTLVFLMARNPSPDRVVELGSQFCDCANSLSAASDALIELIKEST